MSSGWTTDLLSKIPFELHIPGYQYCGPNTNLKKRLLRGDPGINPLDSACKQHDIFYSNNKSKDARHIADNILAEAAAQRITAPDSSIGERLSAMLVTGAMKAKVKLGGQCKKPNGKKGATSRTHHIPLATTVPPIRKKVAQKQPKKGRKQNQLKRTKKGGLLPLIPIFAGLSAAGAIAGGASHVAKAINENKNNKNTLDELMRHNKKMEAIALGKEYKTGNGFYLSPYKRGHAIYGKSKN